MTIIAILAEHARLHPLPPAPGEHLANVHVGRQAQDQTPEAEGGPVRSRSRSLCSV